MGQHMVGWGLARNTGRIYAYLLLQPAPTNLDQMAAELHIAKSGASVGTRQLVAFGMVRALGERGSRRMRYEALHSIEAIFAARTANTAGLMRQLREGAAVAPPGAGRELLEEMAEAIRELLEELPAMLRRIRERRSR
jgi:DNA-binding transcriptional regulator GbsR (MarR family)